MGEDKLKEENKKTKRNPKIPIIVTTAIIILLLFFSVIFALVNINNDKILSNISIMGIDVGGMSREEAEEAVLNALQVGYRLIDTANAYLNERASLW